MNFVLGRGGGGKETKDWKDGNACEKCGTQFSMITRKHHCRSCGGIFCSRCSSQTKVIPQHGAQAVRVCDACFAQPKSNSPPKTPSPLGQSPPLELSLGSSLTRSVFESWIGEEEPKARWVSSPNQAIQNAYGTSPPLSFSTTPPDEVFDIEVKTAEELEEEEIDREEELRELEERKRRKEEKRREKEKRQLIESMKTEEKEREDKAAKSSGGQSLPPENDGAVPLDNSTSITDSTEVPSPPSDTTPIDIPQPQPEENVKPEAAPLEATTPEPQEGNLRQRHSRREQKDQARQNGQTRKPKPVPVENGVGKKAKEFASAFWSGLRDSFRLKYALITLFRSKTVLYRTLDVFILNVLLLGSYMLFFNLLVPHFNGMLHWKENHYATVSVIVSIVNFLLNTIFWLLWLLPLFALSFVLNAHWYEGIAYGSFGLHTFWKRGVKVNADSRSIATVIGEALYRNLIFGAFLGLGLVCSFIPYVGMPLYFLNLCWIYSVYCYEYKWNNQSWGLTRKLEYFETRWIYFAGFGTPLASISFFLDYFTGYALVSLLFPVFIPIAMYGSPSRQKSWQPIPLSKFVDNSILTPVIIFLKNRMRPT